MWQHSGDPYAAVPADGGSHHPGGGQGWPGACTAPLPALGEPSPPSARQSWSPARQVCPLGICVSPDPSHHGCERVVPGDAGRQGGGSACPGWDSGVLPTSPRGHRAAPERLGVPECPSGCLWARGAGSWAADTKGGSSGAAPGRPCWHGALVPPQPKEGLPLGAGAPAPQTQPLELATLSLLRGGHLLPGHLQALVWG